MIIQPKIRGFVCVTTHPTGCATNIANQINYVKEKGLIENAPKKVLVVGCSTGYGLGSRIAAAFGGNAATIGICFEKPASEDRTGTAGWYNTAAFENEAQKAGLYAKTFNADAFSNEVKDQVIQTIKDDLGSIDMVVYSLASPRRNHPTNGQSYRSALKPVGQDFTAKNLNTDKQVVDEITLEAATQDEIDQTVAVMGGEDWEMWMDALNKAGVLSEGCKSVAYSYIGPEVTWPIYKGGTIGRAKDDLARTAKQINDTILAPKNGKAFVSVNKAVVTQASSAIPVVPLYVSIMMKIMKAKGTHEGVIEQMDRLWRTMDTNPIVDEAGRIRVDNYEMAEDVQNEVKEIWTKINTDNLNEFSDFDGYKSDFLNLFGFGVEGVNYEADVDPLVWVNSIAKPAEANAQ